MNSMKGKLATALISAAVVIGMMPLFASQVHATDGVQYLYRSWDSDSKKVVTETRTANCVDYNGSMKDLHQGWYYVNGYHTVEDRVNVSGEVNIIILDGSTLYLKDGIHVPASSTLNIYNTPGGENGLFNAVVDTNNYAAIGGNDGEAAGNINIHSGKVIANAYNDNKGDDAAGIGGGCNGNGGTVRIYGGTVMAQGANESSSGGAGIGGGDKGTGGETFIYGGTVTATGGPDGAGIGGGNGASGGGVYIHGGKVIANGGNYAAGIGSGDADGDNIHGGNVGIYGGDVTAAGGCDAAGIGGGEDGAGGNIHISAGTVKATGGVNGAGIGGGDCGDGGTITISGGDKITATGGANGAGIGGGNDRVFTKIEISGGTIEATGGDYAAGIGSGDRDTSTDGGTINISGGNVTAKGGTDAAGIGGGECCSGGTISITNGEVIATGGVGGAGIGGGDSGNGGTITIENGVVKAKGGLEIDKDNNKPTTNNSGAGIGGGYDGNGGIITIKGGAVEARGGDSAAGIGGGSAGDGGKITISGGTITASGEINGERIEGVYDETTGGAGIGGGRNDNGGEIIITGGTIDARGGHAAAGIGGGVEGNGGTITIKGGTIKEAKGGFYADYSITTRQRWDEGGAGIGGGGDGGSGGTITIDGGTINAHGGCLGAGIGGGSDGASGQIVINDGEIKEAKSGNGGAGIGSGSTCTKDNAVNVTINGGKIRAVASGAHLATEGLFSFAFNPGAAIGAGGPYYKTTALDPPELVDEAYFNGTIDLKCGDVTVETKGVVPIGGTEEACVNDSNGKVIFNGATVRRHNIGTQYCRMVYAKEFQFGDLSQSVSCYTSAKNYNEGKTTLIVPKNERANKIQSSDMPFEYVVVDKCNHSDSTYNDNDSDHDSTHSQECNSCNYIIDAAEHNYGDPEWTWAKDCSSATAEFKCIHCGHGEEVTAEITSDKPAEGGETQEKTVYTATVTFRGKEYIDKKTKVFSKEAEVIEAPKAQSLTYNAEEQALVTAGVASNGKMLYALGESGNTAPAEEKFSETIPTGINAGSYRVWYMAKGNEGYNDTDPKSLTVTIAKLASANLVLKMDPEENEYTGNEIKPAIVATCNGKEIPLQQFDYTIFGYEKNIEVGQASVTVVYNSDNSNNIAIDMLHLMVFVPFKIVQATNNVSVALEDWTVNEEAKTPQLTADFGADTAAFVYKKKDAEDSTYTDAVPSEEGEYTVKATIPETKNYAGAEATCDFEITHEHGWGEPSYEWAEDNSTVTATRVCTVEGKHTQTETVNTTSEVTTEPTCENKGEATYTATFKNEAFATQTKTAEVPALGHDWSEPSYEWAKDNSTVTATRVCTLNPKHVQTETVNTSSNVTTEPTCEDEGAATYTAAFENAAFETQTKTADIPALGHDWNAATYEWSDDNKSVTATRVCKRDASHKETETVEASEETKPATCTENGKTTYTSGAFENEAFDVQTKTEANIDALGHDWGEVTYEWADGNKSVTATRACNHDAEHKESEIAEVIVEITKHATCTSKGETTYTASFENEAFKTQTKTLEDVAIDPDAHTWDEGKVTKEATESEEGEMTYTCTLCGETRTETILKVKPTPEPTPAPTPAKSTAKPVLVAKGIASGKTSVNISWNKVAGADRYAIYLAKCNYKGKKYSFKRVKVVNANTLKWKKTKLSKKTAYKFYVVAEKKQGSTYKTLAKSIDGHFLTGNLRGKYTNPKSLKLSKSAYTLKKGRSATIKGSVSKVRKGKKLTTSHAATYRYTSNNPSVATVNSKGKITAKGQGTAVIYVQTINGIWKTCKVTVK
ncbi:MAG: hypothetical protein IJH57_02875 [Mogibacterium sp.]|nr:hypothetical protein [Mogibacterium sp.]